MNTFANKSVVDNLVNNVKGRGHQPENNKSQNTQKVQNPLKEEKTVIEQIEDTIKEMEDQKKR
jgi:hypothetical protein